MYYYLLTTIKILVDFRTFWCFDFPLLHKDFEWNYFITSVITIIFLIKFSLPFHCHKCHHHFICAKNFSFFLFSCSIFSVLNRNVWLANCPVELITWNILDLLSSCYRKKVCIYEQSNINITRYWENGATVPYIIRKNYP